MKLQRKIQKPSLSADKESKTSGVPSLIHQVAPIRKQARRVGRTSKKCVSIDG
jgi:hypothetical protein